MLKYCILGTDLRSKFLRKMYEDEKKEMVDITKADVVITPIPFSKDGINVTGENITCDDFLNSINSKKTIVITGAVSGENKKKMEGRNIQCYDLMENDSMAIKNAIPTAEGAIEVAFKNTNFTLHRFKCTCIRIW